MKKTFNKIIFSSLISSVLFIALGVCLFVWPGIANIASGYILGSLIVISAGISIVKYFSNKDVISFFRFELVFGILSLLLGIFIMFNPLALTSFLTVVLGLWMVISGTIKLQYALEIRKYKEDFWPLTLAIALLILLTGILLVFNPFNGTLILTEIIGLFVIVYGVLDIVEIVIIKRNSKKIIKLLK